MEYGATQGVSKKNKYGFSGVDNADGTLTEWYRN